ncbi:hypothetical protein RUM43_007418 [Polyplax serrata]|uniref:E3 ubiquitin-protein ligase RBBP6 n=1 Tax=Polyplax serrata TaxID=468196 RepID=A0AAN8Q611_POLSC
MSVHYKFKSALEYDTVTFDGLHISVKDLKRAILRQKRIGKTSDFDLQVTNAQTKETYSDENVLIPKNASLIVARVPLTQQQLKQWDKEKQSANAKPGENSEQNTLSQVDISSLDLSEEEKIKTMITQSTSDYDPSNYIKVRGGNQVGTVPTSYICFKCHQHGHWIKDCPSSLDSSSMCTPDTVKKSTGIPRSFMIQVEGPQVPGARITPSGIYAVPAIDHEVYNGKKIEKPPFLAEKEKPAPTPTIPEDLICGICKDLLQDAVMIPCCGISFCDECIRTVLVDSEESECPDCNEKNVSPDTMIPNRFLRNSVNTFKNKTGYVKAKGQLIQQRLPSPPRPSLPDFVPPPDYVESTTAKDNQTAAKADKSPILVGSPSSLQIHHSPFQSQTTPIYSEKSPFGENSNSSHPDHDTISSLPHTQTNSFPSYQYHGGSGHHPFYQRPDQLIRSPHPSYGPPGPGMNSQYPNYSRPPPNFVGPFPDSQSGYYNRHRYPGYEDGEQKNVEGKDSQRESGLGIDDDKKEDATKTDLKSQGNDGKENFGKSEKDMSKLEKLKKAGLDIDDVSSVSSNASEEPPPPVENRRPNEGHHDPSQGPSYAIPSLFSGQNPVILPPPNTDIYSSVRQVDHFSPCGDRSSTPTVDERLEIRPAYEPFRPSNYMGPGYDQHSYGMSHPASIPYDPGMTYDRGYRGMPRGPRMHRGRYIMRQPPPPGSRPLSPPRNEEEAYLAFQRMLKEKEERVQLLDRDHDQPRGPEDLSLEPDPGLYMKSSIGLEVVLELLLDDHVQRKGLGRVHDPSLLLGLDRDPIPDHHCTKGIIHPENTLRQTDHP